MEERIIGDDGDFLAHIIKEDDTRRQAENLALNARQREKSMLSAMRWLEKQNVKGFPRFYSTIGSGNNRLVVCTTPCFDTYIISDKSQPMLKVNYPALTRLSPVVLEFRTRFNFVDAPCLEEYKNPLPYKVQNPNGWTEDVTLFHNLLRSNRLGCIKSSVSKMDGGGINVDISYDENAVARIKPIELGFDHPISGPMCPRCYALTGSEAQGLFDTARETIWVGLEADLLKQNDIQKLASGILGNEGEKQKNSG